jgi:hypothetical protein
MAKTPVCGATVLTLDPRLGGLKRPAPAHHALATLACHPSIGQSTFMIEA